MTVALISCGLNYDLLTQDIDTPNSSPYVDNVDVSIPEGYFVAGSGAIVISVWDESTGTLVPIDSLAAGTVASAVVPLKVFSGPHPTDSTKWRIALSLTNAQRLAVRTWVAIVGT